MMRAFSIDLQPELSVGQYLLNPQGSGCPLSLLPKCLLSKASKAHVMKFLTLGVLQQEIWRKRENSLVFFFSINQKKPHVRNFSARNSGAGNWRANFMGAWDFLAFCWKTPVPIKFLLLGVLDFFGRGGCQYYFYGRGDFSKL